MKIEASLVGVHTNREPGRRQFTNCVWCGRRVEVAHGRAREGGHCCRLCLGYEKFWKQRKGLA